MIIRIKIDGFKSLLDTQLYLGPFTCIVGANAVGKSNFFDALTFLSNLADKTIVEAAMSIRSENKKHSNIKDLFYKSGEQVLKTMKFEVDMLIPKTGIDDLGQPTEATITSLRYILDLELVEDSDPMNSQPIRIVREELHPITLTEMKKQLFFEKRKEWVESVLDGRRGTNSPFISTNVSTNTNTIKLHQDGKKGRTTEFSIERMPRTLLSTVTAESPTACLARQEMRNWMELQFEPSALREPNKIFEISNAEIESNGLNLPATLYKLHIEKKDKDVYQSLTNKLKGLVDDVVEIFVDKDEKHELLTLQIKFKGDHILPAQSLSDGTLRFLGLAVLEEDYKKNRVICLEEPENGINPKKIDEMLMLLQEMAVDTESAVDEDNPLRQVIINTHSPLVVAKVPDESLYLAKNSEQFRKTFNRVINYTCFFALNNTWKVTHFLANPTSISEILHYLNDSGVDILEISQNRSIVRKTVAENIYEQLSYINNENFFNPNEH